MKPFGQTLFCRLVIGRLLGKGDTFMDLPTKGMYETFVAILVPLTVHSLLIVPHYLSALYPTNTFLYSLVTIGMISLIFSQIWFIWFMLVFIFRRSLAWGDVEDRVLATLVTGAVPYCIYGSTSFANLVRTESVAVITFVKLTLFCCFLVATVVPTYSVWQLQKR